MRKCLALALLVTFGWIGGLGQDARAGVTLDVVFLDSSVPTGITFTCRSVGPGCSNRRAPGGFVSAGWCAAIVLQTDHDFVDLSMGVDYDTDHGLAIHSVYSWEGPVVGSPSKRCDPLTPVDNGSGEVREFGCAIPGPPPPPPPVVPPGTYVIGTAVWDTSDTTFGGDTISAVIDDLVHGMTAVINGNTVALHSSDFALGHHEMTAIDNPDCDTYFCGSGEIDLPGEECDDGDRTPGDGCSAYCKIEHGWECTGYQPSVCSEVCGNGLISVSEQCDDDGTTPGDGCDGSCQLESGWSCEGEPSVCTELAGVPSMSATGVTVLGVAVFGIGVMGLVIAARRRRG